MYDHKRQEIIHVPNSNGRWCKFEDFIAYAMEISEYVDTEKYFSEKKDETDKPKGGG
jgi:hypothetical protein